MFKKPEFIFLIFAFIFGFLILFLTPPTQVCDENDHFLRAKEVSQGILYNNLPKNRTDNYQYHGASGYSPVMYVASGFGLKLTHNYYYAGRIFNLIVWILLIGLAIHITPIFKWAFLFTALLPTSIFQGMSYSADSFSNAFAFLFIAYIFKLIFNNKQFSYKKDLPLLYLFSIIGALCKGIIFPIYLVPLIPIKKNKILIFISLLTVGAAVSLLWASNNYTAIRAGISIEQNKYFLLHYPAEYIVRVIYTSITHIGDWIHGAIGVLYWIRLDIPIIIMTVLMFIGNVIFIKNNYTIKTSHRVVALISLTIQIFMTCTLMFFMFTLINSNIIEGIQGRYFISIIPLLFILLGQNFNNLRLSLMFKRLTIIYLLILLMYTCYILKYTYQMF